MEESSKKDLPLVANTSEILVNHYVFNLNCNFEEKIFTGNVILSLEHVNQRCIHLDNVFCKNIKKNICDQADNFCSTVNNSCSSIDGKEFLNLEDSVQTVIELHNGTVESMSCYNNEFELILDCKDITVIKVEEVDFEPEKFEKEKFRAGTKSSFLNAHELMFCVTEWSLKIWKPGTYCVCTFPKLIKVSYQTKPDGKSLLWVKDQDFRPAVYTYGSWINNRSLFPCQEPPEAMATWEASIVVKYPAIVLMSGDCEAKISSFNGLSTYFYYTKMKCPLSVLALAVGFWDVHHVTESSYPPAVRNCRIFASPSILEKALNEFSSYIPKCLKIAESILGIYPFSRLDALVVPRGFGSLGMASPNIMFLSQSLLAGDKSMCYRVAHEIAHTWFGLLIGAFDWTEEWLSEGFATYLEDIFHSKTICLTPDEEKEFFELKAFLRLKMLKDESENVEQELQILRPNQGEISTKKVDGVDSVILKNGRNPEKGFIQVHYNKGYFLLRFLSQKVGFSKFLQFLKLYIRKFKGQLVKSKEFLEFYAAVFPEICSFENVKEIIAEWLHNPHLPQELENMQPPSLNKMYTAAICEACKWKTLNMHIKKRSLKRKKYSFDSFIKLSSDQLIILLENLLEEEKLAPYILKNIAQVYNIENANAEVRHRWCELVVKCNYKPGFSCLQKFLVDDLAMGVYLYSEMLLGRPSFKTMAEECFFEVKLEMEPNYVVTIEQWLNADF